MMVPMDQWVNKGFLVNKELQVVRDDVVALHRFGITVSQTFITTLVKCSQVATHLRPKE